MSSPERPKLSDRFFTPNQSHYVQEFRLTSGLNQTINMSSITFDLNYLAAEELTRSLNDYHPLIISINYNDNGRQYAMMSYGVFTKDGDQNITGARIEKQVVLVSVWCREILSNLFCLFIRSMGCPLRSNRFTASTRQGTLKKVQLWSRMTAKRSA